jgi:isocitrate dehydrogenase kinase/phosphatase
MFEKLIPYDAAYIILDSYIQYYHVFKRITKRAKIRFEQRDWVGIQEDAKFSRGNHEEIIDFFRYGEKYA